jgi:hypothetical protein
MGLYYASSMIGNEPALALSHEGTSALASPRWAALRRTLAYPIERIAAELGYDVI